MVLFFVLALRTPASPLGATPRIERAGQASLLFGPGPVAEHTLRRLSERASGLVGDGRISEAVKTQRRVLRAMGKIDHPDELTALHNLADTLYLQGELVEVERLQRELLHRQREKLGCCHPEALETMGVLLPVTLAGQGRFAQARRALVWITSPQVSPLAQTSLPLASQAMDLSIEARRQMEEHLGEEHEARCTHAPCTLSLLASHPQLQLEAAHPPRTIIMKAHPDR